MNLEYCKQRKISIIDSLTPILVPSFSSKGIKCVGCLHSYLKEYLSDASLISAYDLYHGFIHQGDIYETDIIFIDSGGYEKTSDFDLSEIYGQDYYPMDWNHNLFLEQISKLEHLTKMVFVNYDFDRRVSLQEQSTQAKGFFKNYPDVASDFLCKPVGTDSKFIDVSNYCGNVQLLSQFSILGFTEKELGSSVLERCCNIQKIRRALAKVGMDLPMHIFGCLDPLNVLAYFLSGADIFDGLSWLRFSFSNGIPTYFNSFAIASGRWSLEDMEVKALGISENLLMLINMQKKMSYFIKTNDWSTFGLSESILLELKKLITECNRIVEMEENGNG